jgi:hypothetical protein
MVENNDERIGMVERSPTTVALKSSQSIFSQPQTS